MNGFQITFVIVLILCTATSLMAVVAIIRARDFSYKPLWVLGSLFGFVGMSIDWASPDDLIAQIGVAIPVVRVVWFSTGAVVAQAMFPVVAAVALWKIWAAEDLQRDLQRRENRDSHAANDFLQGP